MTIKINSLINANAEVYYESSTNDYTYKGSLSSGGSMDVSVSYYDPVWVLVIPSSSSAYVSVTATTNYSYSSSSYSSDDSYLVAIIVPTVVGGTLFIILIVIIIVWSARRRQRMIQYQNNMAAAVAHPVNSAPQPQLYYPPHQQNYSAGYANQSAVVMGTQQPTYPSTSTPRQNIYIIEPTPRTSEPIIYGPADPVPENSIYVAKGVPVNQ